MRKGIFLVSATGIGMVAREPALLEFLRTPHGLGISPDNRIEVIAMFVKSQSLEGEVNGVAHVRVHESEAPIPNVTGQGNANGADCVTDCACRDTSLVSDRIAWW